MQPEPHPTLSRRTVLRGAALTALTSLAFLNPAQAPPAHAAAPDRPNVPEAKPKAEPHPSYAAIAGLL